MVVVVVGCCGWFVGLGSGGGGSGGSEGGGVVVVVECIGCGL